jgi:hypothetical protein
MSKCPGGTSSVQKLFKEQIAPSPGKILCVTAGALSTPPIPAFYYPPQSNRLVLAIAESIKEDTVTILNMLATFLGIL